MLKIDLPQDPAVPRVAVYHKDSMYYKRNTFLFMFIAALLIVAKYLK